MPWEITLTLLSSLLLLGLTVVKLLSVRRDPVARLFCVCFALLAAFQVAVAWSGFAAKSGVDDALPIYAVFGMSLLVLPFWHALSVSFGRDNPGAVLRGHRGYLVFHVIVAAGFAAVFYSPWFIRDIGIRGNSFIVALDVGGKAYLIYVILALATMGVNLESTYRSAAARIRAKFKYAFTGAFAALAYFVFANSLGLLFSASNFSYLLAGAAPISVAAFLYGYSLVKKQLVDTRVPVARSVFYTSFTISGIALYILALGVFGKLTQWAGWEMTRVAAYVFGFLAVFFLLTLVISSRVQRAVKRFVDRNFYVNRYDYRHQWRKLTKTLNPALSSSDIERVSVELTSELLWAKSVSIFLAAPGEDGYVLSSSTAHQPRSWKLSSDDKLVELLLKNRHSVILDRDPKNFEYVPVYIEDAELLDSLNIQVCTPLTAGGKMIGILACGPKKGNIPYNFEDIELLDTMSGQIANAISRATLSNDLAEAKELETFHRFSSFVLHDLKNLTSTMGLLAANAEQNMENPEFQADAMKVVSSTADKMKSLIAKISSLPKTMQLDLRRCEIQEIIGQALNDCGLNLDKVNGVTVIRELEDVPPIVADPTQLTKVFTNLFVNAVESMPDGGELVLTSEVVDQDEGLSKVDEKNRHAVVVRVRDTGCGMDTDFMEERLFRPFASTKPKGLGIGLYQCKTIVDAHHGKLEVESEKGRGTTFTVRLPTESVGVKSTEG
jgi:putative PEP-CTERM system histidine kinase